MSGCQTAESPRRRHSSRRPSRSGQANAPTARRGSTSTGSAPTSGAKSWRAGRPSLRRPATSSTSRQRGEGTSTKRAVPSLPQPHHEQESQQSVDQAPPVQDVRGADLESLPGNWRKQLRAWEEVAQRFGIDQSRYREFSYLSFMPDLNDIYLQNYVRFQLGVEVPVFKGRIAAHFQFWETLATPEWCKDDFSTIQKANRHALFSNGNQKKQL